MPLAQAITTSSLSAGEAPEDAGLPAYRTTFTLLAFGLMLLFVLWMVAEAARPAVAPAVVGGIVTLGLAAAGKSAWQHHVNARADAAKADQ